MNIQEAKQIRIADYLQSLGYTPVKQQGNGLWYKSPFREETEASFKVNTDRNLWFDYGLGKGGNIIALAEELYASDYVPYLLNKIAERVPHIRPVSFSFRQQASEPSFQHLEVRELTHPALIRYLQERGISTDLARLECKELHFIHNGKPYFAIGFPNVAGGYEVRNRFFKGCIAPKDISHIRQHGEPREKCLVFEGMMDYLSFLTLRMRNCLTLTDRITSFSIQLPLFPKPWTCCIGTSVSTACLTMTRLEEMPTWNWQESSADASETSPTTTTDTKI